MSTVSSLLSLHSDQTESREAVAALKDAIGRVESMKILYDKLYKTESYRSITVQDYLYNLIDEIYRLFPSCQHVKINRHIEDIEVDARMIFPLGIIMNELLTNTMKHAFNECGGGELSIEIKKEKDMLHVRFADNGSGFKQEAVQERKSFGLQLIDMLVDQLTGTYSVTTDAGTEYVFTFPL